MRSLLSIPQADVGGRARAIDDVDLDIELGIGGLFHRSPPLPINAFLAARLLRWNSFRKLIPIRLFVGVVNTYNDDGTTGQRDSQHAQHKLGPLGTCALPDKPASVLPKQVVGTAMQVRRFVPHRSLQRCTLVESGWLSSLMHFVARGQVWDSFSFLSDCILGMPSASWIEFEQGVFDSASDLPDSIISRLMVAMVQFLYQHG